jgi:hypothetical protein
MNGESPGMAFIRKMPIAAVLGLFFSWSDQHEKKFGGKAK